MHRLIFHRHLCVLVTFPLCVASVHAEEAAAEQTSPGPAVAAAPVSEQAKTINEFGQSFVLTRSMESPEVKTDEYVLEGETQESWTQRVSYQRVALGAPASADLYVATIKQRLAQLSPSAQARVLQQGPVASIFAIQYPPTNARTAELALVLVTVPDPRRPEALHLIQYTLNPQAMEQGEVETAFRRWQARFQAQAAALNQSAKEPSSS